ncbi:hypothetical protein OHA37_01585 [Streptomyces sp. NBC_00335]|uniref:hypothetical protein n=1 Tax=unclassified Streptomyces TaxID=2593676 RepID=UPI00224D20AE|nr:MULTISPECIES: hypothetical protein [unclassified Streptomyces]MCX5402576.1 hypothetical protein [Streptomyces sp. NBC_00086]
MPRAIALLATLLCVGCTAGAGGTGGAGSAGGAGGRAAPPPPAPEQLDRIAAALGCVPEVTVDAQEVREGACAVDAQAFRLATFSTAQGRSAWLAESRQYGGTYLVGERWIITAPSADALAPARARLGGTLESAPAHPHGGAHPLVILTTPVSVPW